MWTDGAFDLHVHAGPSFFERWGTGAAVAQQATRAGMAGVVLKAHEGSSVGQAADLHSPDGGLVVRGGVVLNRYVGGINPDAVDAALRLGGRCVWFPTIDAADHVRVYGSTGAYDRQSGGRQDTAGMSALDDAGELTDAASAVLELARDHDVCIATGHLGRAEIDAVLARCADLGHRRVLVQHPCARTPGLDIDDILRHTAAGAHVELTWLSLAWEETTLSACAEILRRAGATVVVSSDAGQRTSPPPAAALDAFGTALEKAGAPPAELRRALTDTPRDLIEP